MANATVTRIGQKLGTGDNRELFLKISSGEVMATFNTKCVMKDKVRSRTISSGKSAQFPAIGKTKAEYHTAGTEITGNVIQSDEKVITIDDMLIAHTFIADIDEAISHFEVRSEYSRQLGDALAQTYDRNLLSLAVKACRNPTTLGKGAVGQGDAVSKAIGATPNLATIITELYTAAQVFDEKNIPEDQRFVFVAPSTYWKLVTDDKLMNRDFGSKGVYAEGNIWKVAGLNIIKTNNLALDHSHASQTANYPDYSSKYAVNASDTVALVMHGPCLATLNLLGLTSRVDYDPRRLGHLMVSKMAVGHGILRPEGLYELRAVAP